MLESTEAGYVETGMNGNEFILTLSLYVGHKEEHNIEALMIVKKNYVNFFCSPSHECV